MTPFHLRDRIIIEKVTWIRGMPAFLRTIPLESYEIFHVDPRNDAAAESYLRRALEGLLDLGRHILARGFGKPVSEYKEIARNLIISGALDEGHGLLLRQLAGYRNLFGAFLR
jgi:uncharacterized protein YutE (UPF0331/DUF86 family)